MAYMKFDQRVRFNYFSNTVIEKLKWMAPLFQAHIDQLIDYYDIIQCLFYGLIAYLFIYY